MNLVLNVALPLWAHPSAQPNMGLYIQAQLYVNATIDLDALHLHQSIYSGINLIVKSWKFCFKLHCKPVRYSTSMDKVAIAWGWETLVESSLIILLEKLNEAETSRTWRQDQSHVNNLKSSLTTTILKTCPPLCHDLPREWPIDLSHCRQSIFIPLFLQECFPDTTSLASPLPNPFLPPCNTFLDLPGEWSVALSHLQRFQAKWHRSIETLKEFPKWYIRKKGGQVHHKDAFHPSSCKHHTNMLTWLCHWCFIYWPPDTWITFIAMYEMGSLSSAFTSQEITENGDSTFTNILANNLHPFLHAHTHYTMQAHPAIQSHHPHHSCVWR